MINKKTFFVFVFCFLQQLMVARSQDGLDTNSFDTPAAQDKNLPADENKESAEVDMDTQDAGVESDLDDSNNQNETPNENVNTQPVEEFDQGVSPLEQPNELSGVSLNPALDALKQEYYPSFIYDDRGRKDPFAPIIQNVEKVITEEVVSTQQDEKIKEGLSKYEVSALKVSAILIGKGKPKALVRDPSGVVYVIHENDIVGRNNGIVKKIRSSQIVIVEARDQKDGDRLYTTQVLSVAK